jgi:hypothetical protein
LLRDRAAAFASTARICVTQRRSREPTQIDAGMIVEAPILDRDYRPREIHRQIGGGQLFAFEYASCSEDASVIGLHEKRRRGGVDDEPAIIWNRDQAIGEIDEAKRCCGGKGCRRDNAGAAPCKSRARPGGCAFQAVAYAAESRRKSGRNPFANSRHAPRHFRRTKAACDWRHRRFK